MLKAVACAIGALGAVSMSIGPMMGAAQADPVSEYYAGRRLTMLVGYGPGAGYDVYARALIRHYARHIPGSPTIIVQNMPGAGSLKMLNHLANVAPRDGSALGAPARGLFFEPLYGNSGTQYDPFAFTWIGSMGKDVPLCFSWHTSGITTVDQLKSQELVVGAGGAASDSSIYPLMLNGILGTKLKVISGYDGSDGISLAMEREEVRGYCGFGWSSIKSARKAWIDGGKIYLLLQMALTKHPELPQVPLVLDLVANDADRQALEVAFAQVEMARPIVAPQGVPDDRAEALRNAFEVTMTDPEFLQEAEKVGLEVDPMSGPDVLSLIKRVYAAPKSVVERVIELRPKTN